MGKDREGKIPMLKKINESEDILWLSFPALVKFDFLHQRLILKNKQETLFTNKYNLKKDLEKSLKIIAEKNGPAIYSEQVHKNKSAVLASVNDIKKWDFNSKYDAFITNQKCVFLTVRVADCLPIYLIEPDAKAIGLIHAGWRSTILRIVENTLEQMYSTFKADIDKMICVIGPGLGKGCFEISEELAILFPPDCQVIENGSKPRLDLAQVNFKQLVKSGLKTKNISIISECTHCNPALYYSFRRSANKNQRMVAFIGLKG